MVSVDPWFAQSDDPLGTAILLPGRMFGMATPVLHWPTVLLTQIGWSVRRWPTPRSTKRRMISRYWSLPSRREARSDLRGVEHLVL